MDDRRSRFKELLDAASANERSKADILLEFKEEIAEARLRKFSFVRISEFLKQVGFDVSSDSVRNFCQEFLKEKSTRRRTKRSKDNSLGDASEKVILSDERASLSRSFGGTPEPGFKKGTSAKQANVTTPADRVGPRPGFRVARDNL